MMLIFMLLAVAQLVAIMPLARAQSYDVHPDYTVERWTTREGLPANTVIGLGQRQILQGADGYLWFTTIEGLVRFDGLQFTVFAAGDTPGLLSNRIVALVEAPLGTLWLQDEQWNITRYHEGQFASINDGNTSGGSMKVLQDGATTWIGTGQGLAYYRDGRLVPYRRDVFKGGVVSLVRDVEGAIWVKTTSGQSLHAVLYRIEPGAEPEGEDTAEPVVWSSGLPQLVAKSQLLPDRWRGVWAATERGLVHLAADHVLAHYPYPETWQGQIQQVNLHHQDAEGGLLVGVIGLAGKRSITNGWGRLNPDGTYTEYPLSEPDRRIQAVVPGPHGALWHLEEPWNQQDTSRARLFRDAIPIFEVVGSILDFAFTSDGNVWVLTATEGLFRLRRAALISVGKPEGLPSTSANIVLEDRNGVVWVSTERGGFARLNPDSPTMRPTFVPTAIPIRSVQSVHEDRSGTLWAGSGILCRIAGNQCLVVETPFNRIRVIHEDRHGRFWVGSDVGLVVGQRRGEDLGSWTRLLSPLDQARNRMLAILETRDGTLLFGTNGDGLLRYTGGPGPPDSSQAQTKTAPGAFETLTTDDGLLSNNIRDLYEDAEGYLWIALEDQGLCRLSPGFTEGLHRADLGCFSKRDGLYHNGLHRILEDDQGRFWFNTNNGIFWVERSALMARLAGEIPAVASVSYTEAEGMRNREGNGGSQPAGIKASDGRLWFPTQGGVVIIDPKEISLPMPPPVVLETVQIGDKPRRDLAHSQEQLTLSAEERDIAFHYTALAFTRPQDVRFQVRLVGYDDTWNDVGVRREAQYTNLPPGRYRFEVRAGRGGVWGKTATLALRRPPLFWETTWFYVLLGLMALGAVGAFVIYRTRRHRAREADLERVVAERTEQLARQAEALHEANEVLHEANDFQSRFLANISHEFRTPLTLTFGPINDLVQGRFDNIDEAHPHFVRARRNGHRLLRLINQLLELSRLDAGALTLNAHRHDLTVHLREIAALFQDLAHQRRLHFTTELPDSPFWHVFDADKIEKVVVNLLSNAVKFTPPYGQVSLSLVCTEADAARIEVADTGPGIAAEHLPHLFDRFYQVENISTRTHEGSGIGLALAKELVALHEGQIEVESTVGFGSRFTVLLPLLEVSLKQSSEAEASGTRVGDGYEDGSRPIVENEQFAFLPEPQDAQTLEPAPTEEDEETSALILIVEDNADMRAYLRAHLSPPYRVIEAPHGKEGVRLAQEWVPDLVLSDVMMPEMDGLTLTDVLKTDVRTSHIPVMLLTAKAEVEDRIAGYESGADAYLPKPFDAEELRVRVRGLIEERQRLRVLFGGTESITAEEQAARALPPQEAEFMARVQEAVEAHLGDATFGVEQLAEAVHMSRRQLLRKLQALITESPSELLRRARLERATCLLKEGHSVKEVAHAVGFKNYASFSRAFNSAYGVLPSAYGQDA